MVVIFSFCCLSEFHSIVLNRRSVAPHGDSVAPPLICSLLRRQVFILSMILCFHDVVFLLVNLYWFVFCFLLLLVVQFFMYLTVLC